MTLQYPNGATEFGFGFQILVFVDWDLGRGVLAKIQKVPPRNYYAMPCDSVQQLPIHRMHQPSTAFKRLSCPSEPFRPAWGPSLLRR